MTRKPRGDRRAVREKVAEHRAKLRARGLRPVQLWIPDMRSAEARAEAERQSCLVDQSAESGAMMERLLRIGMEDYAAR
ncbi:antitoxin MazE family protein [Roseomonas stagni]|uniref:Antitoxin MazE family protein n=1 Tax=Falsiroseomonas algicola TaxID=2716930 RepID=A0A6M1LV53_9PROT|nr:antitoxin MazE-like protein [Falsiroseomonas algicola]NGM24336.1 antitoxin MazE family protein [Falsiroseomonas algicola]